MQIELLILTILLLTLVSAIFHPEYQHKLQDHEKLIISLEDSDDGLEIITEKISDLKPNLDDFHKYVDETHEAKEKTGWEIIKENVRNFFNHKWLSEKQKNFENSLNLTKRKRSETFEPVVPNLNYTGADLKSEYEKKIKLDLGNGVVFNYTDEGKPEENIKESIKKIVDVKKPVNCSKNQGFGVKAVECIYANYKNKEVNKKEIANKVGIILAIWFALYLVITIPLWCIKGWCCCCFRCELCQPYRSVKAIQKYIALNPPGIYINSKGEEEHYSASIKETEIYQELNKSIVNF